MKHLKIFENYNQQPQVGDYVIIDPSSQDFKFTVPTEYGYKYNKIKEFLRNTIGKLVEIVDDERLYYVEFYNVPTELKKFLLKKEPFRRKNIISWGKTKEEAEMMLKANKYNI